MQGLCAQGQAELNVGLDPTRVERPVKGAELDGVRRALGGEGRVQVEQVKGGKPEGLPVRLCRTADG